MARKPMVTRTFSTTEVEVLIYNVECEETATIKVKLAGEVTDKKVALALAKEQQETEDMAIIKVIDMKVETALYGMTHEEFLAHAKNLDAVEEVTEVPTNEATSY